MPVFDSDEGEHPRDALRDEFAKGPFGVAEPRAAGGEPGHGFGLAAAGRDHGLRLGPDGAAESDAVFDPFEHDPSPLQAPDQDASPAAPSQHLGLQWVNTSAGQWVKDFEKAFTITIPATIIPSPRIAQKSSLWPKTIQPTAEISTMPRPDQIA